MAKKAERKAREEAERRSSGVQPQAPAPAVQAPAVDPKIAKKAARAARAGEVGKVPAAAEGKSGA